MDDASFRALLAYNWETKLLDDVYRSAVKKCGLPECAFWILYTLRMEPGIEIRCDVAKMERVFDNLIRNAVSYSYEGGEISVGAVRTDEGVYIQFINDGDTIPEEKLRRIFEQFYRLDTSRSTKTGGAGLGLAIAKEIVELHGGTITATSANDAVAFTIFLPSEPVRKS